MGAVLGIDTSNYTTSVALFDGATGCNLGRLLEVRPGELGLRQSEALFQHVKQIPLLLKELREQAPFGPVEAVGASTRPRAVEGSYMPCFLAGESVGRSLAEVMGVPFFSCSHQQGHLAAAAWSAGRADLIEEEHLAWHLSGGTTELLLVRAGLQAERIGGTSDISAGQLIDRAGVLLGLPFPAGKALDELAGEAAGGPFFSVKQKNLTFSLSGVENQVKALACKGEPANRVARFVLDTVADVVSRVTQAALASYPGFPVLCSGGVASSFRLRTKLENALFAEPRYSSDNALGVAILTHSRLEEGEAK